MLTIQTTATVTTERELKVSIPSNIPVGEYQVVLVMEEHPVKIEKSSFQFPADDYGSLIVEPSLRREDMYGDFGR